LNLLVEKLKEFGVAETDVALVEAAFKAQVDEAAETRAQELLETERQTMKEGVDSVVSEFAAKYETLKESIDTQIDAKLSALVKTEREVTVNAIDAFVEDHTAKLSEYAATVVESVEAKYKEAFESEAAAIIESFTEKLDSYSGYVTESIKTKAQSQSDLKVAMAEELLESIRSIYAEYNVTMPESVDFTAQFEDHLKESEKLETENKRLKAKLTEKSKAEVITQVTEGMTLIQKEDFTSLTESVLFVSEELYTKRLHEMKDRFLSGKQTAQEVSKPAATAIVTEGTTVPKVDVSKYLGRR
jgi:hypothetical protein